MGFFLFFFMYGYILSKFLLLIVICNFKFFESIIKLCIFKYIVEFLVLIGFFVDINLKCVLSMYYEWMNKIVLNKIVYCFNNNMSMF